MNLSDVFQTWRTYTPETFNDLAKDGDKYTVQYKLASKGYLEQLDGWSTEELAEEVANRPKLAEAFPDIEKGLAISKRMAILLHDHLRGVDNLHINDRQITDAMELFAELAPYGYAQLGQELVQVCQTARIEPEKKRGFRG